MSRHIPAWSLRVAAVPILAFLTAGLGALLAGCEVAKPELPAFTTQLALPLGEERLDIADIVDDEDYLVALQNGQLGFRVTGDPDTVSLDFDLAADVAPQTLRSEIGTFDLEPDAPPVLGFALSDLYPAAVPLHGQDMPVPSFTFAMTSDPEDLADVTSATVASGGITVTVDNGLPVPISSATPGPDQLQVALVDPSDGSTVVLLPVDREIAPLSHTRLLADLAGVDLPGRLAVTLTGGSPGSSGALVTVDAQATLGVSVVFDALQVDAAVAVISAQSAHTTFDTPLPHGYGVLQAELSSGTLTVDLANELAIPCRAEVVWPHVFTAAGDTLRVVVDLAAVGSERTGVDFGGCTVQAAVPLTALQADVRVSSPGSGGQSVAVASGQGVSCVVAGAELGFASVTGTFPQFDFAIDPVDEVIDLPDELEGLTLQRATLTLAVTNTSGATGRADLTLTGTSADGRTETLDVQRALAADAVTAIVLDETNSGIVAFLNNLPTRITLTGLVQAGGDGAVGTVGRGDRAAIDWEIVSPVEVAIDGSHLYGDPEPLDLDEDARDMIVDHALGARAQLEIRNHLPVGIETRLLFATDTLTIKTDPLLAIGPVTVDAGTTDPVTGQVTAARTSRPVVALDARETLILATPDLHALLEVVLPTTGGGVVRVMTTDYVTVGGLVRLDVEVSDEDE
jgi:hypothetical protein